MVWHIAWSKAELGHRTAVVHTEIVAQSPAPKGHLERTSKLVIVIISTILFFFFSYRDEDKPSRDGRRTGQTKDS